MHTSGDIRGAAFIGHQDVAALNFILDNPAVGFRKHYREGLRSRIVEVLLSRDIERETRGVVVDGVRLFPKAQPRAMLRFFRHHFTTCAEAMAEAKKFYILKQYLGKACLATSTEFIVTYYRAGERSIMLCGLQQYVEGEILNPWAPMGTRYLTSLHRSMGRHHGRSTPPGEAEFLRQARSSVAELIGRVRALVEKEGRIPDLAGIGNLVLTVDGAVKLVDINNVAPVVFDDAVYLDDKGYPVCDKSVEVLALLADKLLDIPPAAGDRLYEHFLRIQRRQRVERRVRAFQNTRENRLHPASAAA